MNCRQHSFTEKTLFTPGYIPEEISTLPGFAFQLKELLDDPDTTVCEIVSLLASDPAISLHIIRAANSIPDGRIDNLRDAVIKLGSKMVYGIIVNLALNRHFHASSPLIAKRLEAFWEHSQEIASRCYVLAHEHPHLKPETAMLIGLMHEVGTLPLLLYADRFHVHLTEEWLDSLLEEHTRPLTRRLLVKWNFPREFVAIIDCYGWQEEPYDMIAAFYTDVLRLAERWAYPSDMLQYAVDKAGCYAFPPHLAHFSTIRHILDADTPC